MVNEVSILGNDGKIHTITKSQYYSYINNGFIQKNEQGEEVLIAFEEKPKKDYEFVWEKDLYDYEIEEKDWIIQDLIPTCSVGVWTGKRGTMKTFLILNAISCISQEIPFLGHYETKKGKIIYLDKENGIQIMRQRMPLIKKGLDISEPLEIGFICFSNLKIDKLLDIKEIEGLIEEHHPSLMVVDTYRRGISFEENDAGSVSKLFVDILRPLVEKHRMSIVLIHHDKKGESQGDEMDMIRGSSDLANYSDFILKNERKGKKLIIKQLKMRSAPEIKPIEIDIEYDEESYIKFNYSGEYELQTRDQKASEIILKWVVLKGINEFETRDAKQIAFSEGIKETNFKYGLQNLVNRGILNKLSKGRYRVLKKALCF